MKDNISDQADSQQSQCRCFELQKRVKRLEEINKLLSETVDNQWRQLDRVRSENAQLRAEERAA